MSMGLELDTIDIRRGVDAIFVASTLGDGEIGSLSTASRPIVLLDRPHPLSGVKCVSTDMTDAVAQAVKKDAAKAQASKKSSSSKKRPPTTASRTIAMSWRDSSGESSTIARTRPGWRTPTPAAM